MVRAMEKGKQSRINSSLHTEGHSRLGAHPLRGDGLRLVNSMVELLYKREKPSAPCRAPKSR